MECWASVLENCGGGPSREHYISDGIFEGHAITAFGLHWCNDKPASVGLSAATAKILCKKHNEDLSIFDDEAAKLSKFLSLNISNQPLVNDAISLNGRLIEKWFLKTLLNLGYLGALDRSSFARLVPPRDFVASLFSDAPIPAGAGLYLVSGGITNENYRTGLTWGAVRNRDTQKILGMTVMFNGVRFVVSLLPVPAEDKIRMSGVVDGFDYASANVFYRPRNIVLGSSNAGKKVIYLQW